MLTAECSEKRASVDKDNGNSNFANPKAFYNKEQSTCKMLKTLQFSACHNFDSPNIHTIDNSMEVIYIRYILFIMYSEIHHS